MIKMIYFDNAASTKPLDIVLDKYLEVSKNIYANPGSNNRFGMEAEKIIKESASTLARIIHAEDYKEIVFTSGGTESNNLAIFGTAKGYHRSGKHIVTTTIEHPAVELPFKKLEEEGFEVDFLRVDEKGYINIEELKSIIRQDTILVSIILINNEIGTIQKIEEIGHLIKEINPTTIFHVDGVQAFGKQEIDVKRSKIDLLSVSGHKFNAPKGLGFLYVKKRLKIQPTVFGGGQQNNLRPGTENPAGSAALALAAEKSYKDIENDLKRVKAVKKHLFDGIKENITDVFLNGDDIEKASPYVLNVAFRGLRAPVLLNALEEKEVYLSTGSACHSRKKTQSSVLKALNLETEESDSSVRFSFSRFNTIDEADECVRVLTEIVPMIRRFNRKR